MGGRGGHWETESEKKEQSDKKVDKTECSREETEGGWMNRCAYFLVLIFGSQSFLQMLLGVGVDGGAVCRPDIVPLPHPCTHIKNGHIKI